MQTSPISRVALLLALVLLGPVHAQQAEQRPHIVLVMADDQGWGDMAYNGHPVLKTPNFDAAAASGLRFDRFYAAAPVCSPTRASVLTGRHPNRMGVFKWGHSMRPQEVTVAEALKSAGYTTGHFGKWHVGSVRRGSPDNPGNNGFDEWLSAPNFYDNDAVMSHRGAAVQKQGESSLIAVDAALEWMEQSLKKDAPIFAVVWFGSPHSPHRAIKEDQDIYEGKSGKLKNFYGEITGMDRAFGKLRGAIDTLGIRDNTVLWYCSDNGALPGVGNAGGHRGRKGKVYEGGLLVPAIMEWPARIKRPRTTTARCNTSDIYPTLLEITGAHVAKQPPLDGVSLTSLIEGGDLKPRAMGFWDHPTRGVSTPSAKRMGALLVAQQAGQDLPPPKRSRRAAALPTPPHPTDAFPGHAAWLEDNWKLHRIEKKGEVRWELYDLARDPNEERDCVATEPERMGRLGKRLSAWLGSVARSFNGEDYQAPVAATLASATLKVASGDTKKVVFVAGKRSHGNGAHEHRAGSILLAKRLAKLPGFEAVVTTEGWPKDESIFDDAAAIVVFCTGGGAHLLNKHLGAFDKIMKRGVGLATIHYGVETTKGKAGDKFLEWQGGYFEPHWSVNPHWVARFESFVKHPVTRGLTPFEVNDEWYYHMRFRPGMKGVTPILTSMPGAKTLKRKDGAHSGNPFVRAAVLKRKEPQHVAWVATRDGGGRGFGFTGAHNHVNWKNDNFRRTVLNAIVWISGAEVPADGVPSPTPDDAEMDAYQDKHGDLGGQRLFPFPGDK
ncbi:MAG: sulfatase-like hydrolase/transferase [Planctomycetota bacterium]|nr:sulfatase-like hydrolase/transferase [Planctomycetota bacterium]